MTETGILGAAAPPDGEEVLGDDDPDEAPPEKRRTPEGRLTERVHVAADQLREAREASEALLDGMGEHERVIIAGGPRTGKSTLAVRAGERHGHRVRHADGLIGTHDWSEASAEVARWFDEPGRWLVEGVSAPRALRKWLAANPSKKLDATIVWMPTAVQVRGRGQEAMAKGVATVWEEILPELRKRGVRIIERSGR